MYSYSESMYSSYTLKELESRFISYSADKKHLIDDIYFQIPKNRKTVLELTTMRTDFNKQPHVLISLSQNGNEILIKYTLVPVVRLFLLASIIIYPIIWILLIVFNDNMPDEIGYLKWILPVFPIFTLTIMYFYFREGVSKCSLIMERVMMH